MMICSRCGAEDPITESTWNGGLRHDDCAGPVVDTTEQESAQERAGVEQEQRRELADDELSRRYPDTREGLSSW